MEGTLFSEPSFSPIPEPVPSGFWRGWLVFGFLFFDCFICRSPNAIPIVSLEDSVMVLLFFHG